MRSSAGNVHSSSGATSAPAAALRARRPGTRPAPPQLVGLVERAAAGDASAWEVLVARFTPALRAAARGYRLNASEAEDVVQATWAAAFAHIGALRKPVAISGWLMLSARREAIRTLRRQHREVPVTELPAAVSREPAPVAAVLEAERARTLRAAVDRLPARLCALLRALLSQPDACYYELSATLGMPVGSLEAGAWPGAPGAYGGDREPRRARPAPESPGAALPEAGAHRWGASPAAR